MDVREKLALSVCNATQKTNFKCEFNCEKKGKCAYCLVMADQMIANDVTVQEWISVKDRLPTREDANETESILAINKDEKYVGRWVWDIVARWPTEFTYWMPMPKPPKGE